MAAEVDPCILALYRYRRRKFDSCIENCNQLLEKNPQDQAMLYIKLKALTQKLWQDDLDIEEDTVGDVLLDENFVANAPRPGTSFKKPETSSSDRPTTNMKKPITREGRPLTGFARPGTSRPKSGNVEDAFQGGRPGTARPITSSGRYVRLGTSSMRSMNSFGNIKTENLDLKKYSYRMPLAKALCDYFIFYENNPKRALELAAFSTVTSEFKDWWWKSRLGKCYFKLGLLREAEKQYQSSLKDQDMIVSYIELSKVYMKMDQPNTALDIFAKGANIHKSDTLLSIGMARIYEMMNNSNKGIPYYEKVLDLDSSNVEAIASLASHHFYEDQPEMALRLYRRLLQLGVSNSEIWTNIGLCCFYTSQYDITLNCFQRALAMAKDSTVAADVWYNVGQIAIGVGDRQLAYEAFKISISCDNTHAESYNNLGILELRKGNVVDAKNYFEMAFKYGPYMHEAQFNLALLYFRMGNLQESHKFVQNILKMYPDHVESIELLKKTE